MCSYHEWERFARRAESLIDEDQVRVLAERAAAKLEALAEELRAWASRSGTDWAAGCDRRSRPEWIV
jgi:primosomal protein N''